MVARGSDKSGIDLRVTRAKVAIQGVRSSMVTTSKGTKIGVVKIKSFSGSTAADVSSALDEFSKAPPAAIVLDLRNDAGGLLPGGIDTARLFLAKDKVSGRGCQDAGPDPELTVSRSKSTGPDPPPIPPTRTRTRTPPPTRTRTPTTR